MRLKLITPPVAEPLTLDEVKGHLRVEHSDEDALITALIQATREAVENYTNRQLMPATYELICDELEHITLPKAPFLELVSIQYTNSADVLTTLPSDHVTVLDGADPAVILFIKPTDYKKTLNGVKITFTAGYTSVPESLKAAMKLLIGHLYENREESIIGVQANQLPKASEYLMGPYRVFQF
jgi:uncharacterized phiE125 gp8 family phage protein